MENNVLDEQSRWRDLALVAGLLLLAVAVRGWLMSHTEVLARDSIGFIRYALEFETDPWKKVVRANHQHPGYPLTIVAASLPVRAYSTAPQADVMSLSAQFASNAAAVLLVIPMFFLGKLLFNRAAGFGAAALFQCLPVSGHILSDGLSEPLFLLLASSALAVTVAALRGSTPRLYALAGVFCGLAYLTRPEGALLLAAALLVLVGLQLAKSRRRSLRQLMSCGASLTLAAVAVGSPYVWATDGFSNKPSIRQMLGSIRQMLGSQAHALENAEPKAAIPQAWLGMGPDRPLFAMMFGITLNPNDPVSKRALQSIWGLAGELVKCYHYVAWVPVLLGMWWYRQRLWQVPGMWLLLAVCGLCTAGLVRLAAEAGYMSDRHLMLLVLCGCYPAAAALEKGVRLFIGEKRFVMSFGLALAALLAVGMPKTLEKLHANRAGHHAAGLWLAEHAAPADRIIDDHCWAHYYAGRVFQERRPVASPQGYAAVRYVVIGRRDREINLTSNRQEPPSEQKLRDAGGQIVYHWPVQSKADEAPIVVYAVAVANWVGQGD